MGPHLTSLLWAEVSGTRLHLQPEVEAIPEATVQHLRAYVRQARDARDAPAGHCGWVVPSHPVPELFSLLVFSGDFNF